MKETRTWFGRHYERHDYYARHPVMTPEMIRQLPARRALIIRGGMSPVAGRLSMAWSDALYKRARRGGRAAAALPPVLEQAASPDDLPQSRDSWPGWGNGSPGAIPPPAAWDDPARYPWQ